MPNESLNALDVGRHRDAPDSVPIQPARAPQQQRALSWPSRIDRRLVFALLAAIVWVAGAAITLFWPDMDEWPATDIWCGQSFIDTHEPFSA